MPVRMEKYACTFATGSRNSVNPSEKSDNLCVAAREGKEGWRQRGGNKPRPNLLPSDFTALREGGGARGAYNITTVTKSCYHRETKISLKTFYVHITWGIKVIYVIRHVLGEIPGIFGLGVKS